MHCYFPSLSFPPLITPHPCNSYYPIESTDVAVTIFRAFLFEAELNDYKLCSLKIRTIEPYNSIGYFVCFFLTQIYFSLEDSLIHSDKPPTPSSMYLLLIVTYLLTPVSTFASTLHPIQPNSLQNDDLPNVYNVYNVRNSLPIFQYNNLQDLQQNMDQFLNNINYTTSSPHLFVVQLTDSNSFIFPNFATAVPQTEHYNHQEEEELVGLGLLSTAPQNWIELYGSDIIQQTSIQGIEVQTLSTVDDDSARGEVAYSTGRLQKVSSEYDSKISLYIGFIALIGATSGLTFAPEIEFSTSSSTYYACPVLAGQTVVVKVYPTLTTFTPYTKKLKWNHNLSKFTTKLPFAKLQKASLLTLTGLEDVECFYI